MKAQQGMLAINILSMELGVPLFIESVTLSMAGSSASQNFTVSSINVQKLSNLRDLEKEKTPVEKPGDVKALW